MVVHTKDPFSISEETLVLVGEYESYRQAQEEALDREREAEEALILSTLKEILKDKEGPYRLMGEEDRLYKYKVACFFNGREVHRMTAGEFFRKAFK